MLNQKPQSIGGQIMAKRQREEALLRYYTNPKICFYCKAIIPVPENRTCGEIRKKNFCNQSCAAKYNNSLKPKRVKKEKIKKIIIKFSWLNEKTKKYIFDVSSNWQSARSTIQKHARYIYSSSEKCKCCLKCGYDTHYEVCHIKSVAKFNDDSLIVNEINNIDNLIALCPNHHWEFDKGILKI